MAKCEYCGKEMLRAHGCDCTVLVIGGVNYKRIPFLGKRDQASSYFDLTEENQKDIKCHDCGCRAGKYHHPGCDMETCPVCGEQLLSCGCGDGGIEVPIPRRVLARLHKTAI